MEDLILFTHIPKTSGTSLTKELVEPNLGSNNIYSHGNIKKIISALYKNYQLINGHFAYGLHILTPRKVKYMTFFRDPIERAISFYYFVQQGGDNPTTRHPLCDYAESVTLKEFYQNREFHNHQTRMTAGWLEHKLYPYFATPKYKQNVLNKAIHNLEKKYHYFGVLEEREKSIKLCKERFTWHHRKEISHQKKTFKRAKVNDVDIETLQVIKDANDLDIELYNFVLDYFKNI